MADWFASLANQAKLIADNLVASANAAQEELVAEQKKLVEERQKDNKFSSGANLQIPWESDDESLQILCQDAMERILKLGLSERNFIIDPPVELDDFRFDFKAYIPTAMKLLGLDPNLSHMHSKLSPKMNEETFWSNYYKRCMYIRSIVGLDGSQQKTRYSKLTEDSIVFSPSFEADYQVRIEKIKDEKSSEKKALGTSSSNSSSSSLVIVSKEDEEKSRLKAEEAALAAEVEEALENENIDLGDLEDLNLDDVDDFENIDGNPEAYDSDLEKQIARELEESGTA